MDFKLLNEKMQIEQNKDLLLKKIREIELSVYSTAEQVANHINDKEMFQDYTIQELKQGLAIVKQQSEKAFDFLVVKVADALSKDITCNLLKKAIEDKEKA